MPTLANHGHGVEEMMRYDEKRFCIKFLNSYNKKLFMSNQIKEVQ
jgi:hypothetical protein